MPCASQKILAKTFLRSLFWSLRSLSPSSTLRWLPIRLRRVVKDPCFMSIVINRCKILYRLYWMKNKQRSDSQAHCCFWCLIKECGIQLFKVFHLQRSMLKYSSHILSISFKISAIVLIFILGLSETIGGFFVFSGIIALTERTERGASFMLVPPHLKSLKYRKMVHKMELVCRYTSQVIL